MTHNLFHVAQTGSPSLGARLKVRMAEVGMSNGRLAELLGVDPATVSQWRSGKFPPSEENLLAMARALDVEPQWLRSGARSEPAVARALDMSGGSGKTHPLVDLPRQLEMMALAFEQEALKAGADKPFMRYARARLRDPALFEMYAGGHDSRPLTAAEQRDDYAEVIDDLKVILKKRLKRFKDDDRLKRKIDDED